MANRIWWIAIRFPASRVFIEPLHDRSQSTILQRALDAPVSLAQIGSTTHVLFSVRIPRAL